MLLYNVNSEIFYSHKEYTGGWMYPADFVADRSPTDIFCQFSNIQHDAPALYDKYVKLLEQNDFAEDFNLPNEKLIDKISNAILFTCLTNYGMMAGSMLESHFMRSLNDANMDKPEHSVDGYTKFLTDIEPIFVDAVNAVVSLVNQLFKELPDVEIYTQQKIGFKFIPFNNGLLSVFEIDDNDFLSFLIYIYREHLASGKNICRCKNCDRVFVPTVRKKEVYCDHVNENNRTCRDMGYENTMDAIDKAYRKAYKTRNAQKQRKIEQSKRSPAIIEKYETLMKNWVSIAQDMKQKVRHGTISEVEYFDFLDKKLDE